MLCRYTARIHGEMVFKWARDISDPHTFQYPCQGRNVMVTTISHHLLNVYHELDLVSGSSLHLGVL